MKSFAEKFLSSNVNMHYLSKETFGTKSFPKTPRDQLIGPLGSLYFEIIYTLISYLACASENRHT